MGGRRVGYAFRMDAHAIQPELASARATFGSEVRLLRVGQDSLRLSGLDRRQAEVLGSRFGAFLGPDDPLRPAYQLQVFRSGRKQWLVQAAAGELYRLEALGAGTERVILSYHFALCEEPGTPEPVAGRAWRVAIVDDSPEPVGRILDNVARFLAARAAIDRGGFAMHGAGVLREGRAHVFAGPSRSGKSTAVRLSRPSPSLGDDFAIVVPDGAGWGVPALPFDNAERIDHEPPRGLVPLSTIWRLFQAPGHAVERPAPLAAIASLFGCVAFPWAVPESADSLLSRVARIVEAGRFGHLHFRPDPGFWSLLV